MANDKIKGLYPKLLHIQRTIVGLGKDKDTSSQYNPKGYKYVTGDKVLGAIKPLMNDLGLILKQEVLSIENSRQDYTTKNGSKSEILSKVMMRFTWIDCETGEKDENLWGANGQNDFDKGCGSAFTYGERYFLLKFFHIATDEDDIDNPDRQTTPPISEVDAVAGLVKDCNAILLNALFDDEERKKYKEVFAKPGVTVTHMNGYKSRIQTALAERQAAKLKEEQPPV